MAGVIEVLTHLRNFPMIRRIIDAYFPIAPTTNVPRGLILPALDRLSDFVDRHGLLNTESSNIAEMKEVAEDLLRATIEPVVITSSLLPDEFLAMQTLPHFRLEYLGLLCAIGSRGHVIGLFGEARDAFMLSTLRACTICLQLSRELTSINDAMVWLSFETMILCSNIYGDLSKYLN